MKYVITLANSYTLGTCGFMWKVIGGQDNIENLQGSLSLVLLCVENQFVVSYIGFLNLLFVFSGGGGTAGTLSQGEMSLAEVQCHLDKEGASDLVIDLIMNATSDRVFHESILLAIALLEGGNTTIQVSTLANAVLVIKSTANCTI